MFSTLISLNTGAGVPRRRSQGLLGIILPLALLASVAACGGRGRTIPPDPVRATGGNTGSATGGKSGTGGSTVVGTGGAEMGEGGGNGGGPDVPPAVDVGPTPLDTSCAPGMHQCNGVCSDDQSPMTCGNSCVACPEVTGGTSTCDGTKCGGSCPADKRLCMGACIGMDAPCADACPTGKVLCNNLCVDPKSPATCGTSCTVCPTSDNGTATCDGDSCDLKCAAGFHECNDKCVPDTSPDSCGASCTPCMKPTGGEATCDNKVCGGKCPSGQKMCDDACIATAAPCNGTCSQGKHACNGLCVNNTDVNACGTTSCTPCPIPANSDATCDGTTCGFKCRAGYHKCGNECKPNTGVGSCGNSCDACPQIPNAAPICENGACGTRCNEGFHKCGNECKPNNSELSCGNACTPCTMVQGGTTTCTAGKCDFTCNPGFHKCGNQCLADAQACPNNTCGANFKFCGNGKCVAVGTLRAEVCDGQDNDCNLQVDDNIQGLECGNACNRQAKKVCKNGQLDDAACKVVPSPSDNLHCGPNGGNKCEACAAGTACMNGNCVITTCPGGQRPCPAENKCVANDATCGGQCPNQLKPCNGMCIPSAATCCNNDQGCGLCEKCDPKKFCVAQAAGEDTKNQCANDNVCLTNSCDGNRKCGTKPGTVCGAKTCRQKQGTCNANGTCELPPPADCDGVCIQDACVDCNATNCTKVCVAKKCVDCGAGNCNLQVNYCDGKCLPKKGEGVDCANDGQCSGTLKCVGTPKKCTAVVACGGFDQPCCPAPAAACVAGSNLVCRANQAGMNRCLQMVTPP